MDRRQFGGAVLAGAGGLACERPPSQEAPEWAPEVAASRSSAAEATVAAGLPPAEEEALVTAAEPALPEPLPKVYLQALGPSLTAAELSLIDRALHWFYTLEVRTLDPQELPAAAYYAPRARYRAEKLLDYLATLAPQDARVIIGLTGKDISTTKGDVFDWGILGLATLDGTQCVISKFRAERTASSAEHAQVRVAKTVVHEVGHALGLPHCPEVACMMRDAQGTVTSTDHEWDLCGSCRGKLGAFARNQVEETRPWPVGESP